MPNLVPQNDTTRLVIYAAMFITVLAGTVALVASGKMDSQWAAMGDFHCRTCQFRPSGPQTRPRHPRQRLRWVGRVSPDQIQAIGGAVAAILTAWQV
ncbi:Uncharacterised protein [Mycobacteroides abscessus subsp. bolletii]|nr:Uncharacterised protein [Mycobacteroides abscessus subsp. bolletii]SKP93417.1 Uncharacterised protein [Mycobacteroides abscessus subsp. bolletii]SKQ78897.1 Uncharacterised protein [Mycobacteroides abscessus subsp. bolletii]SKQ83137.1 Uncharacterised protein [Mycobacteroides abscessus subsp. bolletii]